MNKINSNIDSRLRNWITIALFNFFIAALMGLVLRLAFVVELKWLDFKPMLHGHSHVALLGWLYMVFYALVWYLFIPENLRSKKKYNVLFWFTQGTVAGMMISFPIQGYGFFSITFSTLHLLSSYLFAYMVWTEAELKNSKSGLLLRTAIIWMLVSTLGIWELGPVVALGLKNTVMYFTAIQFFLHFQFNGWFTFGALALLFKILSDRGIFVNEVQFKKFFWLLVISCVLTFALSVTWSSPDDYLFFLNGAGVLIQLGALWAGVLLIRPHINTILSGLSYPVKVFYVIALISFIIKILVQVAVVIPHVAVISYTIRQFVVGFIHLTMLGSISCFVIGLLIEKQILPHHTRWDKSGFVIFIAGYLTTEILLFIQGTMLWAKKGFLPSYFEIIFMLSLLLPAGILIMTGRNWLCDKSHRLR